VNLRPSAFRSEGIRSLFGRELRFADLLPCAFNITWCSAFEELMPGDEAWPPGESWNNGSALMRASAKPVLPKRARAPTPTMYLNNKS